MQINPILVLASKIKYRIINKITSLKVFNMFYNNHVDERLKNI